MPGSAPEMCEKPRNRDRELTSSLPFPDIRIQQRNGRKTLTTVQGLPADLDQKRILKAFKKVRPPNSYVLVISNATSHRRSSPQEFACNGTIVQDEDLGEVIQLQGDHRLKIQQFLSGEGIVSKDKIKIHGF